MVSAFSIAEDDAFDIPLTTDGYHQDVPQVDHPWSDATRIVDLAVHRVSLPQWGQVRDSLERLLHLL